MTLDELSEKVIIDTVKLNNLTGVCLLSFNSNVPLHSLKEMHCS